MAHYGEEYGRPRGRPHRRGFGPAYPGQGAGYLGYGGRGEYGEAYEGGYGREYYGPRYEGSGLGGTSYGYGGAGYGYGGTNYGYGSEFGRGYRGYAFGQRGMGGRRTGGYAGYEGAWGGTTGHEYAEETPSGRYTSTFGRDRMTRTRAADLMTEEPECVTPDATIEDVARKMKTLDVGIIPVVSDMDSRRLRGVVTDRDIAIRAVAEGKDAGTKVGDCMTTDVATVNKNDSVDEVLDVMRGEQVRRVPVTDRDGRLVGIIAQADLAVDYAGLDDRDRELEVEETIERISEPARPRRNRYW